MLEEFTWVIREAVDEVVEAPTGEADDDDVHGEVYDEERSQYGFADGGHALYFLNDGTICLPFRERTGPGEWAFIQKRGDVRTTRVRRRG